MNELYIIVDNIIKVIVLNCLFILEVEFFINIKYRDKFDFVGWFYINILR